MLFRYRERVVPNENELRLLLACWVGGHVPGLFWLLNPEHVSQVRHWLRNEIDWDKLEARESVSRVLLCRNIDRTFPGEQEISALRGHQQALELSWLVQERPVSVPRRWILPGLRHRRDEVRSAFQKALVVRLQEGDWALLTQIGASGSPHLQELFRDLIFRDGLPSPPATTDRILKEFTLLRRLRTAATDADVETAFAELAAMRPRKTASTLGDSLKCARLGQAAKLLKAVLRQSARWAKVALRAVDGDVRPEEFELLILVYEKLNATESDRSVTPGVFERACAAAEAILRTAHPRYLPQVNDLLTRIRLTESSRPLVEALLKYGGVDDVRAALEQIARAEHSIYDLNHTDLGRAAARRMQSVVTSIPAFLLEVIQRKDFWKHVSAEERRRVPVGQLMPLLCHDNRPLYLRIAAYAAIGCAGPGDLEHLLALATHEYSLIAQAAAIRLVKLCGQEALRLLAPDQPAARSRR